MSTEPYTRERPGGLLPCRNGPVARLQHSAGGAHVVSCPRGESPAPHTFNPLGDPAQAMP